MFTVTIDTPLELAKRGVPESDRVRKLDGMTVPSDTLSAIRALDAAWGATHGSVFSIHAGKYVHCGPLIVGSLTETRDDDDLSVEHATTGTRPGRLVFLGVGRR